VDAAEMLVKVLLSREALAGMALAVRMGAFDRVLRSAVFAVDLALVSKKATRICEPGKTLATGDDAAIWALVLVHMFTVIMLVVDNNSRDVVSTYFHSHRRWKALTSSLQSSTVQWNFPSAAFGT
jgi:hypothetical protein